MSTQNIGTLLIDMGMNIARLRADVDQAKSVVGGAMADIKRSVDVAKTALGALGMAGAGGVFVGVIKGAIDAADQLNKLSQRTGIATEALSQLQYAARLANVSADSLTTGIKKLNVSIAEGLSGDKDKIARFKELGITLTDTSGKAKTADAVLLDMAEAFSKAKDGAGKSEMAVKLMGRAGDEMIPLLNGGRQALLDLMREADKLGVTIGRDFAQNAEEFNDNLTRMQVAGQKTAIALGGDLVKALGAAMREMVQATIEGGKLYGMYVGLQTLLTGDDRHKANVAMVDLTDKILAGENALLALQNGNKKNKNAFTEEAIRKKETELQLLRDEYGMHQRLGQQIDEQTRAAEAAAAKLRAARENGRDIKAPPAGGTAAKTEFEKFNEALQKRQELEQAELEVGGKLNELDKFTVETITALALVSKDLTRAQYEALVVKADAIAETIKLNVEEKKAMEIAVTRQKQRAEEAKGIADFMQEQTVATNARNKAAGDMLKQLEFENSRLGLNAEETARATAVRELERMGILQGTEAWEKYGQAILDATLKKAETQKAISDFKAVWDSVDRTAHDVFVNIFKGGKDAFTKLRDTLKATLLDLLYQMTVRKWLFNITASVTGQGGGVAGAVSQAAGVGQGIGGIGSLISGGTSLANMGGTALANITGTGLDGFLATNGAFGTAGGAMGGIMSTVSAALPYVAIAALAISLLSKKGGGPKTEAGFAPGGLGIAGIDIGGAMQGAQRGDVAAAQGISQGISASYAALAKQLGLVNDKLDVGIFYSMDNAEGGTSLTQLQVTSSAGYNRGSRLGGIENVARGEDALKKALADETTRLLFEALKASDLPEQYKAFLNAVAADASTSDMQQAIDKVTKVKTERAQLEALLLDLTSTELEKLNRARDAERAAIDPMNREILEQIYARQDAIRAEQEATKAAQDATKAAEEQAKAQEALRKATEEANRALADAVTGTMSAYADSLRTTVGELQSAMDKQLGYADALKRFRLSLTTGPLAQLSPEARYNATAGEFNRLSALPVNSDERMSGLADAGQAFLEASQSYNASSMAYFVDLAKVKGSVQATEGAALTAAQISKMQLNTAQSQLDVLLGIKANTGSAASLLSAMTNALIAQIKGGGFVGSTVNPGALAAATGGATGVFSMVGGSTTGISAYTSPGGAFATFTADKNALYAKDGSYIGTAAGVTSYIRGLFDKGDYQGIYDGASRLGISLNDVDTLGGFSAGASAAWARSKGLPVFHQGTDFVPQTGFALLERGERVIPASQNRGGADNRELVAEVRELRRSNTELMQRLLVISAEIGSKSLAKQDEIVEGVRARPYSRERVVIA